MPKSSLPGFNDFCLVINAFKSFLGKELVEYLAYGLTTSYLGEDFVVYYAFN